MSPHLPSLSVDEVRRYSRHLLMPEFGAGAQRRLKGARVLVVGVGGLGLPAALYLAAAGVGAMCLVDADIVDETNLQRQVLFSTVDIGRPKLEVAAARLRSLNPSVDVSLVGELFSSQNARQLVEGADVVIDGTDNFPARYLVNDACVLVGRPNVFGSIARFEGQVSVFAAPGGPCYRCLHPEPPPDGLIPGCGEAGVLGVLPGVIGTIQAAEAIKILTGVGQPLIGRVLLYDAMRMRGRDIVLPRDRDCPVCGEAPSIREIAAYDLRCATSGSTTAAELVSVDDLRMWRRNGRAHMLIDVRESWEHEQASIDGAISLPMDRLTQHEGDWPSDVPVVVHCETGIRSGRAAAWLRAQGVDARSLVGGMRAWAASDEGRSTPLESFARRA